MNWKQLVSSVSYMSCYRYRKPADLPVPTDISNLIHEFVGQGCDMCNKSFKLFTNRHKCFPMRMHDNGVKLVLKLVKKSDTECNIVVCSRCHSNVTNKHFMYLRKRYDGMFIPANSSPHNLWFGLSYPQWHFHQLFLRYYVDKNGCVEKKYYTD